MLNKLRVEYDSSIPVLRAVHLQTAKEHVKQVWDNLAAVEITYHYEIDSFPYISLFAADRQHGLRLIDRAQYDSFECLGFAFEMESIGEWARLNLNPDHIDYGWLHVNWAAHLHDADFVVKLSDSHFIAPTHNSMKR